MIRSVVGTVLSTAVLAVVLSVHAGVPYIYTLCIVAGVVVCGHLVTLDDDHEGGWGNPYGEKEIWYGSLKLLLLKVIFFIALLIIAFTVPCVAKLGG